MTRTAWGRIATTVGLAAWIGPTLLLMVTLLPSLQRVTRLPFGPDVLVALVWGYLVLPPVASVIAWTLTAPRTLLRHCAILQLLAWLAGVGVTLLVTTT